MIYHVDTWERAFELAHEKVEREGPITVHVTEPCDVCCRESIGHGKRDHYIRLMGPRDEPIAFPIDR
jgi:hypothetical protein